MNRRLFSIALIFALSACGGGGGPAVPATGGGTSGTQNVTVQFSVPKPATAKAIARGRHYVSYSTNLAVVTFVPSGSSFVEPVSGTSSAGNYVTDVSELTGSANVATPGKACVNTVAGGPSRTCTIALAIPTGLYAVELSLWSGSFVDAHTPEGDKLSASAHTAMTIAAGSTNAINFAVAGINAVVSSVYLLLDHSTVNWNTGTAVNLSIDLKDAEGNHIMSDGTGNGLVDTSGNGYTAHITLNTVTINGCTPAGTLANINGAAPPYDVSTPPSGTVPLTQNDPCLYALTVTSSDPPAGNANSVTSAPLQTSGVNQTVNAAALNISDAHATLLDASGNVWVFGAPAGAWPNIGGIARIDKAGTIHSYNLANNADNAYQAVLASDGNIYITEGNSNIGYISASAPDGTTAQDFNTWIAGTSFTGIATDSSGEIYAVENSNGTMIRMTPGDFNPADLARVVPNFTKEPQEIAAGPDGYMWIAYTDGTIGSIQYQSGAWNLGTSYNTCGTSGTRGFAVLDSTHMGAFSGDAYCSYAAATATPVSTIPSASYANGALGKDGNVYVGNATAVTQVGLNAGTLAAGSTFSNNFPGNTFGHPTVDLSGNIWFPVNGMGEVLEFAPPANWSAGGGFTISARHGH